MKAINYHIEGFKKTYEYLSKGKYLVYFIPGLAIAITFGVWRYQLGAVDDSVAIETDRSFWEWLAAAANWLVHGVFGIFDFILDKIYLFLLIIVMAPFNTTLGERIDSNLSGRKFEASWSRYISDILRMILLVIVMIIMELIANGMIAVISWFVELWFFKDIFYYLITAFFFGLSFFDYGLERDQKGVFQTIGFGFRYPLGMIITGSLFLILYEIPFLGIPIAPVITVMVSTVAYMYYLKLLPKSEEEIDPITLEGSRTETIDR